MVALSFGLMAIVSGAAVGQAENAKITNNALALATRTDEVVAQADTGRRSLTPTATLSTLSVEVLERPDRTADFGFQSGSRPEAPPAVELQVAAATPFNFDVGVARRQVSGQQASRFTEGAGAEVRFGQGLANLAPAFKTPGSGETAWYFFAASDGRALTFSPSSDPADPNRNFRVQDRAEIGDVQVGYTMQKRELQASLALVQRTVKTRIGPYKESKDESFAGLTLTWTR